MCYACNMCNRCGRYDRMKDSLGKRICFGCGEEVADGAVTKCPSCGAPLPPAFPESLPTAPEPE